MFCQGLSVFFFFFKKFYVMEQMPHAVTKVGDNSMKTKYIWEKNVKILAQSDGHFTPEVEYDGML